MPSASSSSALSSKHGLSQGAIAGLAIGVSLTIVLLITSLVYLYIRNRKRRRWWGGQGGSNYATSNFLDPPRHRRVQPASLVDANPRPGQGLENASPSSDPRTPRTARGRRDGDDGEDIFVGGSAVTPMKRVPILANFEEWMKMATDNVRDLALPLTKARTPLSPLRSPATAAHPYRVSWN